MSYTQKNIANNAWFAQDDKCSILPIGSLEVYQQKKYLFGKNLEIQEMIFLYIVKADKKQFI